MDLQLQYMYEYVVCLLKIMQFSFAECICCRRRHQWIYWVYNVQTQCYVSGRGASIYLKARQLTSQANANVFYNIVVNHSSRGRLFILNSWACVLSMSIHLLCTADFQPRALISQLNSPPFRCWP